MSLTDSQLPPAPRPSVPSVGGQWLTLDRLFRVAPLILLAFILVSLAIFSDDFYKTRNIINIFVQASTLGLMTIGMTTVLITGGIDLSIPSVMAVSAILGAMFMRDAAELIPGISEGLTIFISCVIMLVTGALLGSVNGFAVAYLNMIPFVVTLAMMTVASGTAIWVTNSVSVPVFSEPFLDLVLARIGGQIPVPVIILVVMTIIAFVVIRRSLFGRWLYAIGTNVRAARVSGVPTRRVTFLAYITSGLFAGLTAIVLSARLGSASANMGNDGVVLDIVSAAVVGGVSIYGGVGGPLGAVLGAIFITVISNSMNMLQFSFFTSLIVKGIVIIAFVAIDSRRRSS